MNDILEDAKEQPMGEAEWVGKTKSLVETLNRRLAQTPAGVDVVVSASKVNLSPPGVQPYGGVSPETWQIKVTATKTEKLL